MEKRHRKAPFLIDLTSIKILFSFCWALSAGGANYYVSPKGSDTGNGSLEQPFKTITHAVKYLQAGDSCLLRQGVYSEVVTIDKLQGKSAAPITIRAYRGEKVLFTGGRDLDLKWTKWNKGIYVADISFPVWQLYANRQLVHVARWPNASLKDGSIWNKALCMRYTDRAFKRGKSLGKTTEGLIFDKNPHVNKGPVTAEQETVVDEKIITHKNNQTLAQTGKNFTGALAVLNIGHWITWTRPVKHHKAGTDFFTYDTKGTKMQRFVNYYLLGLQCLDRENEWWYDKDKKKIYYQPPAGLSPQKMKLSAKVRDYNLILTNSSHVKVKGIDFLGSTFTMQGCNNCRISDGRLTYPSTNKFLLGIFSHVQTRPVRRHRRNQNTLYNTMTTVYNRGSGNFRNVISNCIFEYANSCSISIYSEGSKIENCLISNTEWDVNSSGGSGTLLAGEKVSIRRNEVHTAGSSEGIRTGAQALIELNKVYNMSLLQHDGSAINIGTHAQTGTEVKNNWVYDVKQQGIRLDSTETAFGTEASIHHNVVIRARGGSKFKGDKHLVAHNTVLETPMAIPQKFGETEIHNRHTLVRNNLADYLVVWRRGERNAKFSATLENNISGSVKEYLRDVENFDFRPRNGSAVINGGKVIKTNDLPTTKIVYKYPKTTDNKADIGAYEYGDKNYWIAGRRLSRASMPIPANGSQLSSQSLDVMFLGAFGAQDYEIYFGRSRCAVKTAQRDSSTYRGRQQNNIHKIGSLKAGKHYWRVDSIVDGKVQTGETWSLSISK
ncbi:MAG: DUF1565 domain-containing protein [Lentisphaeraceae bacterium]|nr:DUF1565 domain-containing protein [Lentisphaeraceae bacterium]